MIFLLIIIVLFVTSCKKDEEVVGDIPYNKDSFSLTDSISYDIGEFHIDIRTKYEGTTYDNSLFAYMINDSNGMFIVDYLGISNKEINKEELIEYEVLDKKYLYKSNDDIVDIYYAINDNSYLYISIENLNSELDDDNIDYLLNQLDFDVIKKY
jgi:hypothetical protein